MSNSHVDISHDLVDGIFDVLTGNVKYSGVIYPVYKSIQKTPGLIYVLVDGVMQIENGTKDQFIYEGTVNVSVVDESQQRADMKLARSIMNVVRGLLKPARTTTFTCGTKTLVVFSPGTYNEFMELSDNNISKCKLIETYNFIIQ